jgi:proteasome lid subunit RPN8/RPN11
MLQITKAALESVFSHGEETFPEECCGCLAGPVDGDEVTEAVRCTNIQNKLHEKDPEHYPRTAKDAFNIDPLEQMKIEEAADEKGLKLFGYYHSHPDCESYFSAEDTRQATYPTTGDDDGPREPIWPDAHQLIASVKAGKADYAKAFTWDGVAEEFVEEEIEVSS